MWIMIVGGLMITLPAIIVALAMVGTPAMFPAMASFGINMLPFLAAFFLIRKRLKGGGLDLEH